MGGPRGVCFFLIFFYQGQNNGYLLKQIETPFRELYGKAQQKERERERETQRERERESDCRERERENKKRES